MIKKILLLVSILTVVQCSNDDCCVAPPETVMISGFNPASGILETEVTITGSNFSTVLADNIVKFTGQTQAQQAVVTSATANQLIVKVPPLAKTGKISVEVNDLEASSATDFTVPSPVVASFDPVVGGPGMSIQLTGENFSPTPANNRVDFHTPGGPGAGTITAATATQLTVTVPENTWGFGGPGIPSALTVTVGANSVATTNYFHICNYAEFSITSVTFASIGPGNTFTFNYTIRNLGKESLDLTKFSMQCYVSTDNVFDAGDMSYPAGGTALDAGGTLATGQSYSSSWTSSTSVTISSYPYLVLDIFVDSGTVNECYSDNDVVIRIQ